MNVRALNDDECRTCEQGVARLPGFANSEPVEENLFAGMREGCYLMGVRSWLAK